MTQPASPRPAWERRLDPRLVDAVFAAAMTALVGLPSLALGFNLGYGGARTIVTVLASLAMPIALAWRRSHPVASAVTVYAAALAHVVVEERLIVADVLIFVSLYSVTVYGPIWARRLALGSALFGCVIQGVFTATTYFSEDPFNNLAVSAVVTVSLSSLVFATWAVGLARRARLENVESLAERAARLEVERDQQAQIATAAERARIAREMHDIVAHSLSVVIAQADGGRYAASADPAAATRALTTISETGRAALADMRRILGVLRNDAQQSNDLIPQPADTDLEVLVASVRETGLAVSLVRMGTPRALPPGMGLAVYRITQEALTNILKHGGPAASATVLVQWLASHLVIQVEDDGRGAAATSDGAGHGLLGMRERATMLGGTLTAGPRPGGGFRVRAEIPVPGAPAPVPAPLTPVEHPFS